MDLKNELYNLVRSDESIFDYIQNNLLDGLWYWDLENPEQAWMNARFWTVLGYNPDEMPNDANALNKIINQDDLKLANESLARHFEDPNSRFDQIVRYTHKDGSTKWIRAHGLAIRDKEGKPLRMLGVHQDVTEWKVREQELSAAKEKIQESEEKYGAFYNNAPLPFQSLDENGCFLDVNPTWLKTLGYQREEIIGKWFGDFLHPDSVEQFRTNFPAFKKRGYTSDVQFTFRKKDNAYIHVSFEGLVGYTPEGKFRQTYCAFKNVTEQKALEKALIIAKEEAEQKEAEQHKLSEKLTQERILLRTIVDSIPDAIYVKDLASRKVIANRADCQNCGVEKEEDLLGKDDFDCFPVEDAERYLADDQKVMIEGIPVLDRVERLTLSDGSIRWLLSSKQPLYDDSGKIVGLVGNARDITQRKLAEDAQKELLQRFELISQHLPGVIFQYRLRPDGSSHFPYTSPGMVRIFGIEPSAVEQDDSEALKTVHPDDLARLNASIARSVQNLIPWHDIFRVINREGNTLWVEGNSTPMKLEDGSIVCYGYMQDITERKLADEKLKLLNRAVEASSVSVVITDAEGFISYVNPYFSELTQRMPDEVFGKKLRILSPGKILDVDSDGLWKAILSGKEWTGEYRNWRKNGEFYWEKSVVSPIMSSTGKLTHIVSISEDMTERKRMFEELVVAKEKAEESDRLKSAFLANMSHEIRTPMNGILGFAELLQEPELTGEQQSKYIQIIQKSGARMLSMINDLISISKIESGIVDIHPEEVNINSQLQFVYDLLRIDANNKSLNLIYRCGLTDQEAVLITDGEKLYGIISNLVKNAIKFTDEGAVEFGYTRKGKEIEFYVKDTGVGIPKEKQETIFERFIQADISDKMARQGAGLGLAISKGYVAMLGGKIWLESEEERGSTFYFTLPLHTHSEWEVR